MTVVVWVLDIAVGLGFPEQVAAADEGVPLAGFADVLSDSHFLAEGSAAAAEGL